MTREYICVSCGLPLFKRPHTTYGSKNDAFCHDATLAQVLVRAVSLGIPPAHPLFIGHIYGEQNGRSLV